mgnify:CR=1 FL=1
MTKHFITICLFLLAISPSFGQQNSTAYLYASAIDTVYEMIKEDDMSDTILTRQISFYTKSIDRYKGKHTLVSINNIKPSKTLAINRLFLLLYPSPLFVIRGETVVLLSTHSIKYRNKRKYETSQFKEKAYYVFFKHNNSSNTYSISKIGIGPKCYDIND